MNDRTTSPIPEPEPRTPNPETRSPESGTHNSLPSTRDSQFFISVVTPSFNQARYIRRNIESVIEQRIEGVEHIVADGGSTDATIEILKQYPHLKWISEKDRGQADALNKAIAMSRGEWIAWVNSDDYLTPGALARLKEFLDRRSGAQFIFSNCLYVDENGAEIERIRATYTREGFCHWWRCGVGFVQTGTFFRRALWEKYGPFDIGLNFSMDYEFWLRFHSDIEFHYLDDYLVAYRLHGESKTWQGQVNFAREMARLCRRHWDAQGGWTKWKWRAMLFAALGQELIFEGIRRWEESRRAEALRLFAEGYARNPIGFFSHPHLCFLLRSLIGESAYKKLRESYHRFANKAER